MAASILRVMMLAVFCLNINTAAATDYYISKEGNDSNTGTSFRSPWATLNRVNSAFRTLKPGDKILFKRGETFEGKLQITRPGSEGLPITISAYGTGNNPVISGLVTLSDWVNEGNGIYSCKFTPDLFPSVVVIDGVNYGMGRFPNNSYLTYESHNSLGSITDFQLGGEPDWTGSEIVINRQNWSLVRGIITSHSGNTLHYEADDTSDDPQDGRGYFIQNSKSTLDIFGEWFYDQAAGRLFIFFGKVNPVSRIVRATGTDNVIENNSNSFIVLNGITSEGSAGDNIYFNSCNKCIIQNCSVNYAGESGVKVSGDDNTVQNNNFNQCYFAAVLTEGINTVISGNKIQNVGLIAGATRTGSISEGVFSGGANTNVYNNMISDVGRMGIRCVTDKKVTIKNNFINNFMLVLNDGGGIYIEGNSDQSRLIEGNIILNGKGDKVGPYPAACGIYLDEYASNVLVRQNTIAFCPFGINLHMANSNTISNNLVFSNGNQVSLYNTSSESTIFGNKISDNIFFFGDKSGMALLFESETDDIQKFGFSDNNYYVRPAEEEKIFSVFSPSTGKNLLSLSDWQDFTGQDTNSKDSPLEITDENDIEFYYNATTGDSKISLSKPMVDIKGKRYQRTVVLAPYTSVVLVPDPDPPSESLSWPGPVTIYPNPANGVIRILITEPGIEPDLIRIIDIAGRIVFQKKIDKGIIEFLVPAEIVKGISLVQLCSENMTRYSQMLIVTHQ